jgi:hypothetical protein
MMMMMMMMILANRKKKVFLKTFKKNINVPSSAPIHSFNINDTYAIGTKTGQRVRAQSRTFLIVVA